MLKPSTQPDLGSLLIRLELFVHEPTPASIDRHNPYHTLVLEDTEPWHEVRSRHVQMSAEEGQI